MEDLSPKMRNQQNLGEQSELWQALHMASPCLLLPSSSGSGEKLKQTLVHLLIPPLGKRAHKLSSYFL